MTPSADVHEASKGVARWLALHMKTRSQLRMGEPLTTKGAGACLAGGGRVVRDAVDSTQWVVEVVALMVLLLL